MKKFSAFALGCLLSAVLFAGIASAHVTVQPNEVAQGAYQVFTVRVPTEKDVATVKVEIAIPAEVNITRFEPKPDWEYKLAKDDTGKITAVAWTAIGEGLSSTEFGEFKMNGKVADGATQITWKAYQTYADGSVVEWVGGEGAEHPASVTVVNASAEGSGDRHGAAAPAEPGMDSSVAAALSPYISIAALVVSIFALIRSLRRKK